MKSFETLMAICLSEKEFLVDKTKEALENYTISPTEDNWIILVGGCVSLVLKDKIGNNMNEVYEMVKEEEITNSFYNPDILS